jgi:hypothetical protein
MTKIEKQKNQEEPMLDPQCTYTPEVTDFAKKQFPTKRNVFSLLYQDAEVRKNRRDGGEEKKK